MAKKAIESRWVTFECEICGYDSDSNDSRPLWAARWCHTCQRMVHERGRALTPDEVRDLLDFIAKYHRCPTAPPL